MGVCTLREGFERVFDAQFRGTYPKVSGWFESCCALPQFEAVIGDVRLCQQVQKPKLVAAALVIEDAKTKSEPVAKPQNNKAKTDVKPKAEAAVKGKASAP